MNRIETMEGRVPQSFVEKDIKALAENVSDDESKTVHTMDEEQSRASLKDIYRQWIEIIKGKNHTV